MIALNRAFWLRVLLSVGLVAAAVHIDWHLARPGPHRFSFDLAYHWLSAVPVFGVVTWYAARTWSRRPVIAALVLIGLGLVLGQVVQPAAEMVASGMGWSDVMPPVRQTAFLEFGAAGVVTSAVVLVWLRPWGTPQSSGDDPPSA